MTLYEAIFRRKSIRKYRDTEIDPKLLEKIEQYGEDAVGIRPEIRTKWKILKGSDKRLAGLFLVKAPYYVVLYSEICEDYRKKLFECLLSQNCFQPYKDLQDTFLILIFQKKHEHKIAVAERKG